MHKQSEQHLLEKCQKLEKELALKNRELEIEEALERIRARSIAMHKSDELMEVIQLVYEQLVRLNIKVDSTNFCLNYKESDDFTIWTAIPGRPYPTEFHIPYFDHPWFIRFKEAKKKQLQFTADNYSFEEKNRFWMHFFDHAPSVTEERRKYILSSPGLAMSQVYLSTISLLFTNYEGIPFSDEDNAVFKRIGQVFEQCYTRFLDLQKAEAQTREAEIEASLERVRAKALAMHSSKDIETATAVVFNELSKLGIDMARCGIVLINETPFFEIWSTLLSPKNKEVVNVITGHVDSRMHSMPMQFHQDWREKKDYSFYRLFGDEVREYYDKLEKQPGYQFPKIEWYPDQQIAYNFFFNEGCIFAFMADELSEEGKNIFKRFAKVFEQTYTRFLDIQKAESQAREATKQASLDRVRGEIASMRSAADLELITPLIFKELTILGVPFIRCGVFIIDEKQESVNAYLSSPEGNSLGVLKLSYHVSELTQGTVEAWRKSLVYRQHWNKEDFIQWINLMMEQDQIQDSNTYQGAAAPPESLNLHFIPFSQGMLYVGAESPLDEKEIELVQSLAKAFSIAYARYEDFVKLELAKADIESALSELKATQSQLVQQEKLASLGQLTAGIAHEIKNPLNFVNNFSEVSIEMIDEIIEARAEKQDEKRALRQSSGTEARGDKRDESEELEDEILEDIKENLRKIHEHGSRANGIVTSMLQHSRGGSGKLEPTDLNALIKEYVNLSFHGMRAGKNPINVDIILDLDPVIKEVSLIKEDFTRVVINLCNNSFDAMRQKTLQGFETHGGLEVYLPKLTVRTKAEKDHILIEVEDNGPGIPEEIRDKILQPFFTTKKGTEGTGLGLSITHDIVKAHGGELKVESMNFSGAETVFIIYLPI